MPASAQSSTALISSCGQPLAPAAFGIASAGSAARSRRARSARCANTRAMPAAALPGSFELGILRRHVVGQIGFLEDPLSGVLEGRRDDMWRLERRVRTPGRVQQIRLVAFALLAPGLLALVPRPAPRVPTRSVSRRGRQYSENVQRGSDLAGIPFALPIVQEPAGRETVAQTPDEPVGQRALHAGRPRPCSILRDSKSSIETKVGSPPMVRRKSSAAIAASTSSPEGVERLPGLHRRTAW